MVGKERGGVGGSTLDEWIIHAFVSKGCRRRRRGENKKSEGEGSGAAPTADSSVVAEADQQ